MTAVLLEERSSASNLAELENCVQSSRDSSKARFRSLGAVLVVEDNDDVRAVVHLGLEARGFLVFSTTLPSEAIRLFDECDVPISLLLTDVVMPEFSGRELYDLLRARRPELKVLYMSGYPDDVLMLHGISAQEFALIRKPFTPIQLASKIHEVLMCG